MENLKFYLFVYTGRIYIMVKKYKYDKYFSISACEKAGGTCDTKEKEIYWKNRKESNID